MTVQELIDELAALPPDMPVAFPDGRGYLPAGGVEECECVPDWAGDHWRDAPLYGALAKELRRVVTVAVIGGE